LPNNERDLAIMAENSYVLPFDNLSGITPLIADALCRLSTGGGFSTRQLWEGREEEVFHGVRPIIVNGIAELVSRPDLADRAIFLTLPMIEVWDRKREKELLAHRVSGMADQGVDDATAKYWHPHKPREHGFGGTLLPGQRHDGIRAFRRKRP
jgi:hypothetical protein